MAKIFPILNETQLAELPSKAEAIVYQTLKRDLDDTYLVIHSKTYVAKRKDGSHTDGEADFVIFSAKHGLVTVEVKGGGIMYDPASGWYSIDRMMQKHQIKNPVIQAKNQKFAILDQLQSSRTWVSLRRRIVLGHAVLFPNLDSVSDLEQSDCPQEIMGGKSVLSDIKSWVDKVFLFWSSNNQKALGTEGLQAIEKIFCRPMSVRPLLRDILDADDRLRIQLTNEQASVLRTLSRHKRAAIVGAAGTGKTILAVEKAHTLAELGNEVLLLCYNKALGATLKRQFSPPNNVSVYTFHQFCQYCSRKCIEKGITDPIEKARAEVPNDDYFDIQLPLAAFYAIEELGDILRFDAIIVDEGQDFGEEYWLPVEMALKDLDSSWLYIFFDENQRLYSRVSSFPIPQSETFPLTKNCRNSKPVHELAYRFYEGEPVDDSGIEGIDPVFIKSDSVKTQARKIANLITELIIKEHLAPESIGVLVAGQPKEQFYDLLKEEILPKKVKWSREEHFQKNSILMDTVRRFKGLEREAIFLWLDDHSETQEMLMYVGISRAKSLLYIIGHGERMSLLESSQDSIT